MLRVSFSGFWNGFQPADFFLPALHEASQSPVSLVAEEEAPDVIVHSVFRRQNRRWRGRSAAFRGVHGFLQQPKRRHKSLTIWFTGENVRPPDDLYDVTLGFDPTGGRNFRLPLWWLLFPWKEGSSEMPAECSRLGFSPPLAEALFGRQDDLPQRSRFACAFFANKEPTRFALVDAVRRVGEVDVFGSAVGAPVAEKFSVAQGYTFMVCPENSLFPGYVTEKAVEAWSCGAIPLYNGIDSERDLNPEALLNASDFSSFEEFAAAVSVLSTDIERISAMRRAPILSADRDITGLVAFFREALIERGL